MYKYTLTANTHNTASTPERSGLSFMTKVLAALMRKQVRKSPRQRGLVDGEVAAARTLLLGAERARAEPRTLLDGAR